MHHLESIQSEFESISCKVIAEIVRYFPMHTLSYRRSNKDGEIMKNLESR